MHHSASPSPDEQVTLLLQQDAAAASTDPMDAVVGLVYDELCAVAHRQMRRERRNHTLDTRALVNEAYLRLAEMQDYPWRSRGHFFGVAGLAMKQILIQHARARSAKKRGAGEDPIALEDVEFALFTDQQADQLLQVHDALDQLEQIEPRYRQVVEHKIFTGLTNDEIAEAVGVSRATVKRDWVFARAWLNQALGPNTDQLVH